MPFLTGTGGQGKPGGGGGGGEEVGGREQRRQTALSLSYLALSGLCRN